MMLRSALMLVAVLLAGCDSQTPTTSQSEVDEALDSSDVGAHESGFLVAAADVRLVTAVLAADNAERVRANLPAKFLPTGCATATRDNAAVTLTFAGCSGPYGLLNVKGSVTLAYVAGAALTVTASSSDLVVNASSLELAATATFDAAGKTLTVQTSSSGTGSHGNEVSREGSYTVTWTDTCSTANGSWTSRTDALAWNTTLTALERCGGCPQSGTLASERTSSSYTITIAFDGAADVPYTTSAGGTGTVALACQSAT